MLKVKISWFGGMRELLGVKDEEYSVIEGSTLNDLLVKYVPDLHQKESTKFKEAIFRTMKGEIVPSGDGTPILRNCILLIKSRSVHLSYELKDGDEITVLPPMGGG